MDGLDETDAALHHWQVCAITNRIAMGSQTGRKVMTLQTLPATDEPSGSDRLAKAAGFSLHAGVSAEAHEKERVERLCRYIPRPAISEQRLALTFAGKIRYQLKTPYRDDTNHVVLERGGPPSNSQHRALITPAHRSKGLKKQTTVSEETQSPIAKRAAMNLHPKGIKAHRLKRVFDTMGPPPD